MRMSHSMFKTQKRVTAEAELPSHQLILRAGLARRVSSGIYSLTPLAVRAIHRIETIVREEMERIGGQEVLLPIVQPAELWQRVGRYDAIGSDLARFKDRAGHPMVLAMTHEEAVTDLARAVVESYRQLPQMRLPDADEVPRRAAPAWRPRAAARVPDEGRLQLPRHPGRPRRLLRARCRGVPAIFRRAGAAGAGRRIRHRHDGRPGAHEFMLLADGGEDTLIVCPTGDYAANQEIAVARKGEAVTTERTTPTSCSKSTRRARRPSPRSARPPAAARRARSSPSSTPPATTLVLWR